MFQGWKWNETQNYLYIILSQYICASTQRSYPFVNLKLLKDDMKKREARHSPEFPFIIQFRKNTEAILLSITVYKNPVWYAGPNMSVLLSVWLHTSSKS